MKHPFGRAWILALAVAAVPTVAQAHVGFLVEPSVGWHIGHADNTGSTADMDFSGLGFDLKTAVTFDHFELGALGGFGLMHDADATAGQPNDQWLNVGAFAGYYLHPLRISLRAGYDFVSNQKFGETPANGNRGSGFRFGVLGHIARHIALSAEYLLTTVTASTQGSVSSFYPKTSQPKESSLLVSLSVPFHG